MWGPSADGPSLLEPYAESPGGQRTARYFDKTRMEITHPDGDSSSIWYVSNGLLAEELITGRMQLGDNTFEQHDPAQINVAGDTNTCSYFQTPMSAKSTRIRLSSSLGSTIRWLEHTTVRVMTGLVTFEIK